MIDSKKKSKTDSSQLELEFSSKPSANTEVNQNQAVSEPQGKMVYIDFRQDIYRRILSREMK